MQKISLLPLLFSLSLSVAYGAQTQGANEQDKAKENIELKNNKEPSIPPLKRDISRHWGYYMILTIVENFIVIFSVILDLATFFQSSHRDKLNQYFSCIIPLVVSTSAFIMFLISSFVALREKTGKIDDNPNLLSYKKRLLRILKLTLLPVILNAFISICSCKYYDWDLSSGKELLTFFGYIWLVKAVCLVIYWLITPHTRECSKARSQ